MADKIDVTNAAGGTISAVAPTVSNVAGSGTVRNAGTISGGTNSVNFFGTGTNTLILQTGLGADRRCGGQHRCRRDQ